MIEKDHIGDWSSEKDCCWRLTFRQPVWKPSSESSDNFSLLKKFKNPCELTSNFQLAKLSLDSEDGFHHFAEQGCLRMAMICFVIGCYKSYILLLFRFLFYSYPDLTSTNTSILKSPLRKKSAFILKTDIKIRRAY